MDILNLFFHTWYGGLTLMIVCSLVIAKACDVFEASTEYLGRNMNEGVKGATLNAVGSSMPEFLTTVFFLAFAFKENLGRDFAASIGGDTGSAIFNSIIIPMLVIWVVLASGVTGVKVAKKVILRDGLFLILAEVLLLVLLSSHYITHWHGWIFTGFYCIYLGYTLISMKKNETPAEEVDEDEEHDTWFEKYIYKKNSGRTMRSWTTLFISTAVIALACAGLVEGCKGVSDSFGINPLFVALILVAAASSVPDTIISMRDAKKGNHDDALSNVLGSNIFDITISMGLPLAIFLFVTNQKIEFAEAGLTLIDIRIMLLIITIITIGIFYFSKTMTTKSVIALGILYSFFIAYGIGAADYHAGGDSLLAQGAGSVIDYLRQPGGIGEKLQETANFITGGW